MEPLVVATDLKKKKAWTVMVLVCVTILVFVQFFRTNTVHLLFLFTDFVLMNTLYSFSFKQYRPYMCQSVLYTSHLGTQFIHVGILISGRHAEELQICHF